MYAQHQPTASGPRDWNAPQPYGVPVQAQGAQPLRPPVQQTPMPAMPRLQAPPLPRPAAPVAFLDVAAMTSRPAA